MCDITRRLRGNVFVSLSRCIYQNLAFEEHLLRNHNIEMDGDLLFVWSNRPAVVIGRFQNPWIEVNLPYLRERKIDLARRYSGGGTVYHDLGNINFSLLTSQKDHCRPRNLRFMSDELNRRFDLNIVPSARDDMELQPGSRKCSGTAARIIKGRSYHHLTLLVQADITLLKRSLASPWPDKIKSNASRSVRAPAVGFLKQDDVNITVESAQEAIIQAFSHRYEICNHRSIDIEQEMMEHPCIVTDYQTLRSWEYVFGRSPKFQYQNGDQCQKVENGYITECSSGVIGMIEIPFLKKLFEDKLKRQRVADTVDYLNHYVTPCILLFASMAISAKQYFGSPIQCWVPSEFKGGWEKYAEDYCFIANSYYVPIDEDIPVKGENRDDQISYYRWVPIMLALQAAFFVLPNYIWNILHKQTAINPRQFLSEAEKVRDMKGEDKEKEFDKLADYFTETVSVLEPRIDRRPLRTQPRSGYNAMYLYLLTKFGYVFNIFMQIVLLNHFLGEDYFHWGYKVTSDLLAGNQWQESKVFPRVIMCDFTIRVLGNIQNHSVQCVMMLNMINEKLYLFLYFWFLMLLIVTVVNFVYYVIMLLVPHFRTRLVMANLPKNDMVHGRREVDRFVRENLHPDGVLLIQFLREHVGGRTTYELTKRVLKKYDQREKEQYKSYSDESISKDSEAGLLPRPPKYYSPNNNKSFAHPMAPVMEDYNECGTMRVGEKSFISPSRNSPTDV